MATLKTHIVLTLFLMTASYFINDGKLYAASLDIEDFKVNKNIYQNEIQIIYRNIFKSHLNPEISPFQSKMESSQLSQSNSLSTQIEQYRQKDRAASDFIGGMKSRINSYFKNNIKYVLLPESQAGTSPKAPKQIETLEANHLSPMVKLGTGFIKPVLSIENTLNTSIETNISYHSSDKVLEAWLLRPINQSLHLSVQNLNEFKEDSQHLVIMGLKYRF